VGVRRESEYVFHNGYADDADEKLFQEVGQRLRQLGHCVRFFHKAQEALRFCRTLQDQPQPPALTIFNMCRGTRNLAELERYAAQRPGVRVINSPASTRRMWRKPLYQRMLRLGLPLPATAFIRVDQGAALADQLGYPAWLKLPGNHHVNGLGVQRVPDARSFRAALTHLGQHCHQHGQGDELIVQTDISGGTEIKFYGVLSRQQRRLLFLGCTPEIAPELRAQLARFSLDLAASLGVQVFGGDCVLLNGRPYLLDFNSWPSFRGFREPGARAIADCLLEDDQRCEADLDPQTLEAQCCEPAAGK